MPTRDHLLGLAAHGLIERLTRPSRRTTPRAPSVIADAYALAADAKAMEGHHDPRRPKPEKRRQSIDDFVREVLGRKRKARTVDDVLSDPTDAEVAHVLEARGGCGCAHPPYNPPCSNCSTPWTEVEAQEALEECGQAPAAEVKQERQPVAWRPHYDALFKLINDFVHISRDSGKSWGRCDNTHAWFREAKERGYLKPIYADTDMGDGFGPWIDHKAGDAAPDGEAGTWLRYRNGDEGDYPVPPRELCGWDGSIVAYRLRAKGGAA